jgi:hypothetical protein
MVVVDPFKLPDILPLDARLPPLPRSLPIVVDEQQARRIAEHAEAHYQGQRRWKPTKSIDGELFAAILWVEDNLETWPPGLLRALARALGVFDTVENRNQASMAAQLEGRYDAIRRAGMDEEFRLPRPTALRLSSRLKKRSVSFPEWNEGLERGILAGQHTINLTPDLVNQIQSAARISALVHSSPRKIESWRGLPGYKARVEIARRIWLWFLRGYCSLGEFIDALHSELSSIEDTVDERAAEWAVASGRLTSDERLVVFKCISAMNRRGRMMTPPQHQALAVALRLARVGPQKLRAAGT